MSELQRQKQDLEAHVEVQSREIAGKKNKTQTLHHKFKNTLLVSWGSCVGVYSNTSPFIISSIEKTDQITNNLQKVEEEQSQCM